MSSIEKGIKPDKYYDIDDEGEPLNEILRRKRQHGTVVAIDETFRKNMVRKNNLTGEFSIQEKDIAIKKKRIEEIDKRLKELEAIEPDGLADSHEATDLLEEKQKLLQQMPEIITEEN